MDLNGLIWTKNVKPIDGEYWAYESISIINPDLKIFALHWRNQEGKDEDNAKAPQEGELMILRQYGKVTHIVEMLNDRLYREKNTGDGFNIYRLVQVVWITDNWHNPPENHKLFDCTINFPRFGKAIKLENIHAFQERWGKEKLAFQQHVRNVLNIH
ncbi:hypothetical protein FACHB389_00975 [Nostoc calcicola FACHB-389]|nr:hypothetical protein [Nostoc calcicola FACHB-3891]OKH42510.1 hypothetical protein FACHB389_00975 [Nostoc calcicola FACHB-389]